MLAVPDNDGIIAIETPTPNMGIRVDSAATTGTSRSPVEPSPENSITEQVESEINFQSVCIGKALLVNPEMGDHINTIAKLHNVTVHANYRRPSKAVLSGSPTEVALVHNEITALTNEVKRSITAHCMLIPMLSSLQARTMLATISQMCNIEVSLVNTSGKFCRVSDLSHRITLVLKKEVSEYLTPTVPISTSYNWMFMNRSSQLERLPLFVNKILNSHYWSNVVGPVPFQFDDIQYTADLSTMTLTDIRSRETTSLYKELLQSPTWLFSLDQNQKHFLNYVENDSSTLETVYRYGGCSVALSGVDHFVEFISMCQTNQSTGVTTSIRRDPPPVSNLLPDYECHLAVTGPPSRLDEAVQEIMRQLETLCLTTSLTFRLCRISHHLQDIIAIHALNIIRQYCVKVVALEVNCGILEVKFRGESDYCELVKGYVKEQLADLLQYAVVQANAEQTVVRRNLPVEWEEQTSAMELKAVNQNTQEWTNIVGMMHKTLPTAQVRQIRRVQNRQLWEKYALEKDHMTRRNSGVVNEKLLFHGTRKNDPNLVALSLRGIDFRLSRRDHQLLWGTGAYFAVNSSYSDRYCYENRAIHTREMIIAKVLTGHSCLLRQPDPRLTRPPPLFRGSNLLYDTVCGHNGGSDIYVVYDQDRAYPAYIISYHVPN